MRQLFLGLIAIFGTLSSATAQADECKDVLANGVWEYHDSFETTRNVKAFLNWYGSIDYGSNSSTKKYMFTSGGTYGAISGNLGISSDEQKKQEFLSKLEKLNTGYEQYDSTVISFVKSASAVIVKAWSQCMDANAPGIRASLKFSDNPRDIFVDLRYTPINAVSDARVSVFLPSGVSCKFPHSGKVVRVTISGVVLSCTRGSGDAGAITLASDTVIHPEKLLRYSTAFVRPDLTGKPYSTCDVFEEIKNGKDTLGEVESLPDAHDDMGGGGDQSRSLALEVPPGYRLSNVVPVCTPVAGQNPCAFVRHFEVPDLRWTVPGRRVEATPTTDSDRVTVKLTGNKQKVLVGFDRRNAPSVRLAYGKSFSVEFPKNALDVKLYCEKDRSQRIFTLSDIKKDGDQIYFRSEDDGATSKILHMWVLPFDLVR